MKFLGDNNTKNTLIYIQLAEAMFEREDDEFVCQAAKMVEEAKVLVEAGFNYVCGFDGARLFRNGQMSLVQFLDSMTERSRKVFLIMSLSSL